MTSLCELLRTKLEFIHEKILLLPFKGIFQPIHSAIPHAD